MSHLVLDAHFGEGDDGEGLEARGRREGARRRLRRLRLRTGDVRLLSLFNGMVFWSVVLLVMNF